MEDYLVEQDAGCAGLEGLGCGKSTSRAIMAKLTDRTLLESLPFSALGASGMEASYMSSIPTMTIWASGPGRRAATSSARRPKLTFGRSRVGWSCEGMPQRQLSSYWVTSVSHRYLGR